ncbi:UDP-2,4-diacetamido-2,4,6-trideoxy-beta-L-altropyranose hydrolase [Luteolibacter sp. SL250]|uniref:UDP-2,4-diacetamido-2,4, 6-trideoxy-beta-L-altropyranose hydrolase n=1 Tax=Luteolibacter sp. SL250 TaxID=2995170 RepID=UPI0022715EE1|nr:UDP-2,4-diacetamido-2,4,6-trideoxy-beta-L-altropyranose hydrolase [Luteolibacter sp. SL250]WAC20189.1 UDP-2,4-diacetamido-2,4,6-trideoxy-beta-L-altropyranose hydrolase [Luteolibacter sp. SL250]
MKGTPETAVLIRADAGGRLGIGHVTRMIALAQGIIDLGGRPTIVCAACPEALEQRIAAEGIGFRRVVGEPGGREDLAATLELARTLHASWVVADGYHFLEDYQQAVRDAGHKLMCVDDYGHCPVWHADAVLNHNLYAPDRTFISSVSGADTLAGPRFALLRREFLNPPARPAPASPLRKILLTLGGVDQDNATGRVLDLLEAATTPALEIRVLIGAGNPHREDLRKRESRHRLDIAGPSDDMPAELAWADGVISAGGGTCFEWLRYQLPAAVVTIATNQEPVAEALGRRGLAICLGWPDDWSTSGTAVTSLERFIAHADAGMEKPVTVDGQGARRAAAVVLDQPFFLRRAMPEDAMLYFNWANDPETRASSLSSAEIPLESHLRWFASRVGSENTLLFVCEDPLRGPIGQVRFEKMEDGRHLLSYSLDRGFRGQRLSLPMLSAALTELAGATMGVLAKARTGNPASLKTLRQAGFRDLSSSTPEVAELLLPADLLSQRTF